MCASAMRRLVSTMAQFAAATDGPDGIKAVLDREMQKKAAKLLAVTDLGPVVIVSNKQVKTPADLKGVRIRVFSEGTAITLPRAGGRAAADPVRRRLYVACRRARSMRR